MKNVLFVCTGNIFRSLTAEYCLKQYLKENKIENIKVGSAGTEAKREAIDPRVIQALEIKNILIKNHVQRKLTKELISKYNIIIPMAKVHQEYIEKQFKIKTKLFNQIAINKNTSILDVEDILPNYRDKGEEATKIIIETIDTIYDLTPKLAKELI